MLIGKSRRGKFKIYMGMSAAVGKSFRMLQEAHSMVKNGIDVKIGFIERHNRKVTDPHLPLQRGNNIEQGTRIMNYHEY